MPAIVSLQNVVKRYVRGRHTVNVLNRLDLTVEAGEFVALMGPSGSGKTTLLNLIGGLDRADAGEVHVAGTRLDTLSASGLARWRARHVGFVFQFYHLMPLLNAAQNVELPLMLTRLSAAQRRAHVDAALTLVGLAERKTHRPAELSGGQQQRVAIARALVADPMLLVCDEPTGDLDRDTSTEILALLRALNQQQRKTILMVTHDPVAASHASRVLHLDKDGGVDSAPVRAVA